MRARVALLGVIAVVATGSVTTAGLARMSGSLPRSALTANAVAFRDRRHGVLGTGWTNCGFNAKCRPVGTISITSDGGRIWRLVRRTPRPVVALTRVDGANVARYDDGQTLRSHTGLAWHPMSLSTAGINTEFSVCPQGMTGRHWQGLPKVARLEVDFGSWAYVLPRGGVGFVVLAYGGTQYRRLIETTDAGRTWRVVHRWR